MTAFRITYVVHIIFLLGSISLQVPCVMFEALYLHLGIELIILCSSYVWLYEKFYTQPPIKPLKWPEIGVCFVDSSVLNVIYKVRGEPLEKLATPHPSGVVLCFDNRWDIYVEVSWISGMPLIQKQKKSHMPI